MIKRILREEEIVRKKQIYNGPAIGLFAPQNFQEFMNKRYSVQAYGAFMCQDRVWH